jgi:RNA polymerase sigma factor (sigma-70 family)
MEDYNKLAETHTGLVSSTAKRLMKMNKNCDWLTEDDLLGAGYEALWTAACTYDASREASFKTYATTCIRNAMLAEIRNMFPVRVNEKESKSLVRHDESEAGTEVYELARLLEHWDWEQRKLQETVADLLGRLASDERWLIRCYHGFDAEPMTLQEIADLLSVSPQAVHKRLKRVHDKLRKLVMDSRPIYRMCA